MKTLKREGIKPNYAGVAQIYGCDYRTVKKFFDRSVNEIKEKPKRPSKLDGFEDTIKEKLDIPCTYTAIYEFIKKKGFQGKYTILKIYCNQYKMEQTHKATIRFETTPGLQAQVDWKEYQRLNYFYKIKQK